ncbi:MAG: hypothetical protein AB2L20_17125 [Mangrovibacterium sp.]
MSQVFASNVRLWLEPNFVYFDKSTGWNGCDFGVNRVSPAKGMAVVEKNVCNRWKWEKVVEVRFAVQVNKLELEILISMVKLEGKALNFEFKLNDNIQENGNIMDFYVNSDTALGGRFNFI